MQQRAQLFVTDLRQSIRQPVDYATTGEHPARGEIALHVRNVSPQGFLVDRAEGLSRADRVIVRMPVVGRIEGCCAWTCGGRAGFQFERIIRPDDFAQMIAAMQPGSGARRAG